MGWLKVTEKDILKNQLPIQLGIYQEQETKKSMTCTIYFLTKKFYALLSLLFIGLSAGAQIPAITSFSPTSGAVSTSVTITGTNFSATPTNNIVFFGTAQATVTTATTTQLTVTVPVGATYQPITVLTNGLLAYSRKPFVVTFNGVPGIDANSFAAKVDFTTGTNPQSVSIGDLDGDGKADLAVTNYISNTVSVFRNTGSASSISYAAKVDFTTGSNPRSVSIGDLDGDGKADLAVANWSSPTVSIFRNTSVAIGNISYAAKVDFTSGTGPISVSIGDLDGDGKADLAVANHNSGILSVFRNTGSVGSISYAAKVDFTTTSGPHSVSIGDLDGDGKVDLAVANNSSNTVSVFRNTGSVGNISYAAKVDFTTGTQPYSVSIGDLDGDGKADLAVANYNSNTVSVLRNTSSVGSISYAVKIDLATAGPTSVTMGDLDGDGKVDLAVANYSSNTVSVFRNTGSGGNISYAAKVDFTTGTQPHSVSIGDLDGDGKADIAVANDGSNTVSVFRNTILSTPTNGNPNTLLTLQRLTSTPPDSVKVNFNKTDWYYIAWTKASDRTGIMYVNGQPVYTGSFLDNAYNHNQIHIAARFFTEFGSFFNGQIDELRVSNRARNASEIMNYYSANQPFSADANTVALWHFDEGTGSTFGNAQGGSGQLVGGPAWVAGKFGTAVQYDGVDDRGQTNFDPPENNTTYEFWVKFPADIITSMTLVQAYSMFNYDMMVHPLPLTKSNQTITFDALPTKNAGDASFTLGATTSSGLAVSYTSSNTNVATVSGNTVTIVGAGTTIITASQAGDNNYTAASSIGRSLIVNAKPNTLLTLQRLTSTPPDSVKVNFNKTDWYYIAWTKASDRTGIMYVNGQPVYTGSFLDNAYNHNQIHIAARFFTEFGSFFNGQIDELRVSNRARNASEIMNYYSANQPFSADANTVALWHFDEGTGSTFGNAQGGSGQLVGGPAWVAGKFGTAVQYDGVDDRGQTNFDPPENNTTYEFWVKFPADIITSMTLVQAYSTFNYDMMVHPLSLTKSNQTITFNSLPTKVYADATFSLSATASSSLPVTYTSSNTNVATVSGNLVTIIGAGTSTITASQAGDLLYASATPVDQILTVNKSIIVVTALNTSRNYGDVNPAFSNSYSGFKNGETSSVIDTPPVASSTANQTSNMGTYNIIPSGGVDNNYSFNYVNGTLTINKATLTATADNKSRGYGDANPTITITYAGFKNSETSSVIDTAPTASSTATATSNVGGYNIVPAGGTDNNYSFTYVNGTLTINKAALTAPADNKIRLYGDANPAFTLTYTGFKNSETSSVIDTAPLATTTATITNNVGAYNIIAAGGVDNNYSFTYVNGTLTITKATLTATADNKSRGYGDTNPTFTVTYAGFKNSETSSVIDTSPTASSTATATSNVGSYNIVTAGGTDNNYSFSNANGTLTIIKATLTATADNKSRGYGGANPFLTITYTGFKNSETANVIDTAPIANTPATTTSQAGSYAITVSGGLDNNYAFIYIDGSLTVLKIIQTISFTTLTDVVETVGSFTLTATATSVLPVTFSTTNSAKISISGNQVTILSPGSITIKATQTGNNNFLEAQPVSQTICVMPKKPIISSIGLGSGNAVLTSSANLGNQWYRNGSILPNAVNTNYAIDGEGLYTVKVTIDGCASTLSDPYAIIITALESLDLSVILSLYPNPSKKELLVSLTGVKEDEISMLIIYDFSGRTVSQEKMNGRERILDIEQIPSGNYLIRVENKTTSKSARFVKE